MHSPIEWRPGAAMTIEYATSLWAEARAHFASSGSNASEADDASGATDATDAIGAMHIDLSAVERFDTAGCQILIACREDARRRGAAWRLTNPAPQVLDVMRLLGCEDTLAAATDDGHGVTEERYGE